MKYRQRGSSISKPCPHCGKPFLWSWTFLIQSSTRGRASCRVQLVLWLYITLILSSQIKTKPQGLIPLKGSTLSIIDGDTQDIQPIPNVHKKRYSLPSRLVAQTVVNKPNMFCIETADHVRYIIQTESDIERMGWISDITTQIEWLAQRETRSESVLSWTRLVSILFSECRCYVCTIFMSIKSVS